VFTKDVISPQGAGAGGLKFTLFWPEFDVIVFGSADSGAEAIAV
jgi:hypothetical protein